MTSWALVAPITLRKLTSRARMVARAVARLVKLKQATSWISIPMTAKP